MACYNITKADEHNESVKLSIITLHFLCIINKFPVKDLYLNFDTLAIPELHTRQLLILVHKCLHHPHLLPTAFANYFISNSTIHQHNTREKENLHLTSESKDFGKSVKYKASKLWNQLPLSLKDHCAVKQSGSKLKNILAVIQFRYYYV